MSTRKPKYHIGNNNMFVIENYNLASPFSGFFPGIAGIYGKPLWAFFVNRAQGICSFGVDTKNGAMLEFQPVNKSYNLVHTNGFRTFLKITRNKKIYLYEPFREDNIFSIQNKIEISSSDLSIIEKNLDLKMEVKVRYFTIPGESYAALAREVSIFNNSKSGLKVELLDGLPYFLPFGLTDKEIKNTSNIITAWMEVQGLDEKIPFYKLKTETADRPNIIEIKKGNFYLSYHFVDDKVSLVQPIVDPSVVFGPSHDLRNPYGFFVKENFKVPKKQIIDGITPSAIGYSKFNLLPYNHKTIYSLFGHVSNKQMLTKISAKVNDKEYFKRKYNESCANVNDIQNNMFTDSNSPAFDQYCKNTFLDNVLRGGYPLILQNGNKKIVTHLFSRKHGDLERDYNWFLLQPTYFSQGDGNFRDVCQNRRNDIWFNPHVCESNIITFMNLFQLDGFNPLVLKGDRFTVKDIPKEFEVLRIFMEKPFTLGELFAYIEDNNIPIKRDELLNKMISYLQKDSEAVFKDGYWVDHWTYILDLFESYKSIYPDRFWDMFTEKRYTFYDSPAIVLPRKEKIAKRGNNFRQYGSVCINEEKEILISKRVKDPSKVRTEFGLGELYRTTLLVKLLSLAANKAASFDSSGIGIEMEADKPGWYDSLNGLPGLFGSSICEVFELKRLTLLLLNVCEKINVCSIKIPVEIVALLKDPGLKESYRKRIKFGLSGKEEELSIENINKLLSRIKKRVEKALVSAFDRKTGLYETYFINEVVSLNPIEFKQKVLPPFLEAQVHALRIMPGAQKARALYNAVRKNGLYDKKLKMYKLNASLDNAPFEIGRTKVFNPGWLENEAVWIHMEYKYLLELLRNDMYREFFKDFKNVLIAFQDPTVFKRNILENCSFIVSSAHPDSSLHGTGFLPRLSGATAELIHMWLWMCIGKKPFFLDKKNNLNLRFQPILPKWLFKKDNTFSFNFLGEIFVTYHNPKMKDTFNINPKKIIFDDIEINGNVISSPYAERIRNREVKKIDIYF